MHEFHKMVGRRTVQPLFGASSIFDESLEFMSHFI